jgi:urease gamma subunit
MIGPLSYLLLALIDWPSFSASTYLPYPSLSRHPRYEAPPTRSRETAFAPRNFPCVRVLRTFISSATQAGFLAQQRLARGLRLNQTEAIALIASQLQERIRDGKNSVAELMQYGKMLLGMRHVLPGVSHLVHEIQVEGTFQDGSVTFSRLLNCAVSLISSQTLAITVFFW